MPARSPIWNDGAVTTMSGGYDSARLTRDLFDGFAAEVRNVIGLTVDDEHQAGLCLGDPTAYV